MAPRSYCLACRAMHSEFLEVAIPTVVTLLQQQARVPWWKITCVGSCCRQLASPSKYDPRVVSTYCAHKLALDKPQYRGLLTKTLHPNYTKAMELVARDSTTFYTELKASGVKYDSHFSLPRNSSRVRHCNMSGHATSPAWIVSTRRPG